jgi:hypothetical protein
MRVTASILMGMLLLVFIPGNSASGRQHGVNLRTQLEDPILGLSYSYTKVHYELMQQSVRRVCPTFEQGTFWTLAHTHRESGDYFVVMGVSPGQDGDSLGVALLLKDSKCDAGDSKWMLSGFIPVGGYNPKSDFDGLPGQDAPSVCDQGPSGDCHYMLRSAKEEATLRDLVRDALSRGVKAWSEDEFRNSACKSSALRASTYPVIRQELTKFCAGSK